MRLVQEVVICRPLDHTHTASWIVAVATFEISYVALIPANYKIGQFLTLQPPSHMRAMNAALRRNPDGRNAHWKRRKMYSQYAHSFPGPDMWLRHLLPNALFMNL